MPSFKTPTPSQIEIVVQQLRSPEHAAYFFSRLNNPRWIGPLRAHGVFDNPPPPDKDGTSTRYLQWPASRYLARMAKEAPVEVAEILAQIQTDNVSVMGDVLD